MKLRRFVIIFAASSVLGSALGVVALSHSNQAVRINADLADSATSGCTFQTTANPAALCETFDAPTPTAGSRSGDLDGVLWGVSRATGISNLTQGQDYAWASSSLNACGTSVVVNSPRDVQICNGQMVESTNDSGYQTVLAAYPRQPFDFAGRTGTVAFDVSDNTEGAHAAWPAFVLTDQPVPAPYDGKLAGLADVARNSFGISFANGCQAGGTCDPTANNVTCVGVDEMFATTSYIPSYPTVAQDGCVKPSTEVGVNNHVEIQVSPSSVRVFMSDAGAPSTLKLVAHANFTLPLTRGLPWIEDVHYNANKFNTQQTNTFSWDNFAFDGPVLARDLGFDVLDSLRPAGVAENGLPMKNLGYAIPPGNGQSLTLTIPNVHDTAEAAAALLEFTMWPVNPEALTYSVNGGPPHSFAWPFGTLTYMSHTVAMPVPLSEVHDGSNTITLSTSDTTNGLATANYDLILAGAGGIVGAPPPSSTTTTTVPPTTDAPTTTSISTTTVEPSTTTTETPTTATTTTLPTVVVKCPVTVNCEVVVP